MLAVSARYGGTCFTLIAFTSARPRWERTDGMDERKRSAFDPPRVLVISIYLCAFVRRSNLHLEFYLLSRAGPVDTKLSFRDKNRPPMPRKDFAAILHQKRLAFCFVYFTRH